jgi:hypothetical protein
MIFDMPVVEKNKLFDDPTVEIGELTVLIKERIDSLQRDLQKLDECRQREFGASKPVIKIGRGQEIWSFCNL